MGAARLPPALASLAVGLLWAALAQQATASQHGADALSVGACHELLGLPGPTPPGRALDSQPPDADAAAQQAQALLGQAGGTPPPGAEDLLAQAGGTLPPGSEDLIEQAGGAQTPPPGGPGKFNDAKVPEEKVFNGWERRSYLLFILAPVAIFVAIYVRFTIVWNQTMSRRERDQIVELESVGLARTLLHHFMPSIAVGSYEFKGIKKKEKTISLQFDELGLELKDGRRVLDGVTGSFDAGQLIAIMGPSGAGKTTFMNVLCGKATYGNMVGEAKVNEKPCRVEALKSVMGFVPQDDVVHEKLTVRENLRYSAQLRNPPGTSPDEIKAIVVDVLNVLQIHHIQSSVVGGVEERGISGGQRKRVNIGLELAATPTLLFLDEPTSGLDSSSSLTIINSLKKMTELGMTIIMVIHQPRYSIFTLFDTVLLLAKGGRTAFLGSSAQAKNYFQSLGFKAPVNDNPADWLMDVISGDVSCDKVDVADLPTLWKQGGADSPHDEEDKEKTIVNWRSAPTRVWDMDDDRQAAENLLAQEFDKFDLDRTQRLHKGEFRALMVHLLNGKEPSDEAFETLCGHLYGQGAEAKTSVTKKEFTQFVIRSEDWRHTAPTMGRASTTSFPLARPVNAALGAIDNAMQMGSHTLGKNGEVDKDRTLPGFFKQYNLICHRRLVQVWRNTKRRAMDLAVLVIAGLLLGLQHRKAKADIGNVFLHMFALALFLPISCLKCFGADWVMFKRERSAGLNGVAYASARMTVDSLDVILQTMVYTTIYYLTVSPPLPSQYYLATNLLQATVISGWGYIISVTMPQQNAMLAAVVLMLILNGVLGNPSFVEDWITGGFSEFLVALSPARWGMQMLFVEWWIVMEKPPPALGAKLVVAYKSQVFDQGQGWKNDVNQIETVEEGESFYERNKDKNQGLHWTSAVWVVLLQAVILRIVATLILCYGDTLTAGIESMISSCRRGTRAPSKTLPTAAGAPKAPEQETPEPEQRGQSQVGVDQGSDPAVDQLERGARPADTPALHSL